MSFKARKLVADAQAAWEKNQLDAADSLYSQAIEMDVSLAEAYLHRALLRQRLGRIEDALLDARQALSLRPENSVMAMVLGEILLDQGSFIEAIEALRKSIELEKDNGRAHYFLGRALAKAGKVYEAAESFESALQFERDFSMGHFMAELLSRS